MKNQRDNLHQYQKRITVITTRETEIARECLRAGNKSKALLALRRKKYQESLLAKTDQQLAQLEILTSDVEFALVQKDVLFGLQQGTKVLKDIHREMGGLDKIEMIMGESAEAQAYQNVGTRRRDDVAKECFADDTIPQYRRLATCWLIRCRIKTRTTWKMNWRRWSARLLGSYNLSRTHRTSSRRLSPMYLKKHPWRRQRGDKPREQKRMQLRRLLLESPGLEHLHLLLIAFQRLLFKLPVHTGAYLYHIMLPLLGNEVLCPRKQSGSNIDSTNRY